MTSAISNQVDTVAAVLAPLRDQGIETIRVLWPDLHGIARGKDVSIEQFPHLCSGGLSFCQALLATDLSPAALDGSDAVTLGYPDARLDPDLSTIRSVPFEPGVAVVIANIADTHDQPLASSSRDTLQRVVSDLNELGMHPILAPELEFYLFRHNDSAPHGMEPYVARDTAGYLVGRALDPLGALSTLLAQSRAMDLGVFAGNHEFSAGQFEINHTHSTAVDAADRAFLFKYVVKEIAAGLGLHATFMGKPSTTLAGSGFHIHASLADEQGLNQFADPDSSDGLSQAAHHFVAGIVEHAGALMAFLNPTVNAFKRLNSAGLTPTTADWGLDNRRCLVRVPPERGKGSRFEVRIGDATANPYLAFAAVLAAGADGILRKLEPPPARTGGLATGAPLPTSLSAALDLLSASDVLRARLGSALIDSFTALKRQEISRFNAAVTDWEVHEYSWLL